MKELKYIQYRMIKTDDGTMYVQKKAKINTLLDNLAPGFYKITIEQEDTELVSLKKYYFKMEGELAKHLGMKKVDLHAYLTTIIGHKIDALSGKPVYESIADIKEHPDMMSRVYEFQEWAAREHDYTFEPFQPQVNEPRL